MIDLKHNPRFTGNFLIPGALDDVVNYAAREPGWRIHCEVYFFPKDIKRRCVLCVKGL
jgi:hypothetical protein